jgi:hypothetical protein
MSSSPVEVNRRFVGACHRHLQDRRANRAAIRVFKAGLEVRLHLEGPATGQLDQGFPWISLVPEQMLSWYPNSTLHCLLHMQPSQW